MDAEVEVFKERLDKMDTMDLEAHQENSGAIAEQQDAP
jgi:hypothetical protein